MGGNEGELFEFLVGPGEVDIGCLEFFGPFEHLLFEVSFHDLLFCDILERTVDEDG